MLSTTCRILLKLCIFLKYTWHTETDVLEYKRLSRAETAINLYPDNSVEEWPFSDVTRVPVSTRISSNTGSEYPL